MPVEEGDRYRLGSITFTGKQGPQNTKALRAQFAVKDGDWFNATLMAKGLENLKKAYGGAGYINFGAIPKPTFDDAKKTVSLDHRHRRGQALLRIPHRVPGKHHHRDKVIRRELLLDEFGLQLATLGIQPPPTQPARVLRPLKVDQDLEAHQDAEAGTVELLLKVKEKGKNSIGLNGRRQRPLRRFPWRQLPDQHFSDLAKPSAYKATSATSPAPSSLASRSPTSATVRSTSAFQVFSSKQDFNAAKNYQSTTGQSVNLSAAQQSLTQNYNQASTGFNFSVSYPLRRHAFQRVGMTTRSISHHHCIQPGLVYLLPDHQLPLRHSGQ